MAGMARNWTGDRSYFLLVLPLIMALELLFAGTLDWKVYPRSEWVVLFDLCVFAPALYLFVFGKANSLRVRVIRSAGVAGLGVLAAQFIIPDANQFLVAYLSSLRNAVVGFVIVFELFILYRVLSAIYRKGAGERTLERDFAIPAWTARLMVVEAKFWRAVWKFVRRK